MKVQLWLLLPAVLVTSLCGCGGKLAETGCARVSGISPCGTMALQYPNGAVKFKRLGESSGRSDVQTVSKNLHAPARFVETKQGSTLTFPGGDTITYYDCGGK
ncbi:MAG: hypothetical protein V2B18_24895 [Pseudomonadota bacterium]